LIDEQNLLCCHNAQYIELQRKGTKKKRENVKFLFNLEKTKVLLAKFKTKSVQKRVVVNKKEEHTA
jgi:hypothetical protein